MFSLLLAATVTIAMPTTPLPATPVPQSLPRISVKAPRAELNLQVANTESQRELGLMSVTKLPPHSGMIFVFDTDGPVEFWMKDTLLPLDMVFVGPDGKVRRVSERVPVVPLDTPDGTIPRRSGNAKYVIELAAGEAREDGIVPGVTLLGVTSQSP